MRYVNISSRHDGVGTYPVINWRIAQNASVRASTNCLY